MRCRTDKIIIETKSKVQIVRITDKVEKTVSDSGIQEGLVLVNPMHITAAVVVNDDERGLHGDYLKTLERLAPYLADYRHNDTGEDNAAAHIWRQFMGHQVVLPISGGKLDLGPWEQVFYFEFDGMRPKRVLIKAIGE